MEPSKSTENLTSRGSSDSNKVLLIVVVIAIVVGAIALILAIVSLSQPTVLYDGDSGGRGDGDSGGRGDDDAQTGDGDDGSSRGVNAGTRQWWLCVVLNEKSRKHIPKRSNAAGAGSCKKR